MNKEQIEMIERNFIDIGKEENIMSQIGQYSALAKTIIPILINEIKRLNGWNNHRKGLPIHG